MHQSATVIAIAAAAAIPAAALGGAIDLSANADPTSRISEFDLTGAFAQISFGDGGPGDADGAYLITDESGPLGSALDIFPNETDFGVGNLAFDDSALTGAGMETAPITSLDLSQLWTAGSASSDISGLALSFFFFTAPIDLTFGAVDASDTVAFEDGAIVSVDLSIDAAFVVDLSGVGQTTSFEGTFSITGDEFSLFIDETETDVVTSFGVLPQSRVVFDVGGRIPAIPSPGAASLLGVVALAAARRRRG